MIDNKIFDLTGKVVLVTGGSRGLGRCFSEATSAFGANVIVAARDQVKIDDTLKVLSKNKGETLGIAADMTKEEDIQRMIDEAMKKFGRIDVLFNNAGTTKKLKQIHEEVVEDFDFIINTNLRSPFLVLRAVLPVMMKQKSGSVIMISSSASHRAELPEIAPIAYCSAKAAINVMTQIAALEYAQYGIKVNCIAPGIHHSELNRGHGPETPPTPEEIAAKEERMKRVLADFPMGRYGNAEELAGLAVLLASDASSYITGQIFTQDGGRSCKH
jgi:NAD(P)-dependent dehydrogenase (short-subunit alcohol dehydrogenase family)